MEGGLHHKSNLFPVRRHTSLLHFPPNRSFVCQTLAWLREPACSGVGLTIDITVLPELSVCFLHGSSLKMAYVVHSLRGCFCLWPAKLQTSSFKRVHSKAPASLIDNGFAFGPRMASKVEKSSSRGVGLCVSTTLCLLIFDWLPPLLLLPGAGPIDSDRQTSTSLWLHNNMTIQTNRIRDLT